MNPVRYATIISLMRNIMKTSHIAFALLFLSVILLPQKSNHADGYGPRYDTTQEDWDKFVALRDKKDISGIINLCESLHDKYGWTAIDMLKDTLRTFPKETVLPHLKQGLKNHKSDIRHACWDLLVLAGDPIAPTYIINRISPPPLPDDKKAKAQKLASSLGIGSHADQQSCRKQLIEMGPGVAEILVPLTNNENGKISKVAKEIISIVHPPLDRWELYAIYDFCEYRPLVEAHKKIITNEYNPPQTIKTAIYTLGVRGKTQDATVIRPYLKKNSPYLKEAIGAVGWLKDRDSVPALVALLDSGLHNEKIVNALRNIGDKRAIEPLEKNLIRHDHIREKMQHAFALDACGKSEYLCKMLSDLPEPLLASMYVCYSSASLQELMLKQLETTKIPKLALVIIQQFGTVLRQNTDNSRVIQAIRSKRKEMGAIIKNLSDEDATISKSLILLGDKEEEKAILAMVKDRSPEKRYYALSILSGIRTQKYIPVFITYCYDSSYFKNPEYDYKYMVRQAARRGLLSVPEIRKYYDPWYIDEEKNIKEIIANWKKEQAEE